MTRSGAIPVGPQEGIAVTYEIRDSQGRCLYRGNDLALACEIHDHDPRARLAMIPFAADPRVYPGPIARQDEPAEAVR
jgi:hypothetical protein